MNEHSIKELSLLERRVHEVVMRDLSKHVVPYFLRKERVPPTAGNPVFIEGRGIYEIPVLYDVLGTSYIVDRYLVDMDAKILYPSPDNEIWKVIMAKLPSLSVERSN
ncbi:MAG: hypothetical protein ACE5FT_06625 [Candidatus Nanoarchaeia archaeon]